MAEDLNGGVTEGAMVRQAAIGGAAFAFCVVGYAAILACVASLIFLGF
jgi:hypothetical protein